jgi:hypothetical protein
MNQRVVRAVLVLPVLAGCVFAASCASSTTREGRGGSYLMIDSLACASGAMGGQDFAGSCSSDVITYVKKTLPGGEEALVPTLFEDPARVIMRLGLKDVGTVCCPTAPTTNNFITVKRYRVVYKRADGRNTPGVDVPYPFDGAVTFTIGAGPSTAFFTLVRIQSKMEAPLVAIASGGGALGISTIAELTFYGNDQAGNEVSVTGTVFVNFANWGDPD